MEVQFGKAITRPGDQLQKVSIERLYKGISHPKQSLKDLVQQLRTVRSIDEKQYRELKKTLPYFVCGIFHPPIRRKEHFAVIHHFILDIDHITDANVSIEALVELLRGEEAVMLLFKSPGADGLKVLFQLKEGCTDQALFSAFYKLFAHRFAQKHGLEQILDYRTSDATRACFLSYDPDAYYNPNALPIDLQAFIPDLNFDTAEKEIKQVDKAIVQQKKKVKKDSLSKDTLLKIKQKLNPHYRQPRKKDYYIPPQIEAAIPILNERLAEFDIAILDASSINYGKRLKLVCDEVWAEINIFHGKKGFRVVRTTKSGSNAELADVAAQVIAQILETIV